VPGVGRILDSIDFSQISPDSFVVIATGGRFDEEAVEKALSLGARYIALVAEKRRARAVLSLTKGLPLFPLGTHFHVLPAERVP
jgi:xanthine/CO dehydrogenase XdhC/CoxF family maturation factor